jgi:hypothetical protein
VPREVSDTLPQTKEDLPARGIPLKHKDLESSATAAIILHKLEILVSPLLLIFFRYFFQTAAVMTNRP